jgi:hypothetical protein
MISTVLLLAVTSFSFLGTIDYSAHGKKDSDQSQNNKQNANCEAGEDNNNSCNNISITRHNGGNDGGNQVQVSKQNANCEAGEDNNNSCNNISITRHNGGSGSAGGSSSNSDNDGGNQVQVSKQNANCEAGEDNNNSCNNFDLKEMISDRLKILRQT